MPEFNSRDFVSVKLSWKYDDDTFSLIEGEYGYSVVCTSENPSKFHKGALEYFSTLCSISSLEAGGPSMPDLWDNMHGFLSKESGVTILEAEPIEYPEDVVF